MADVWSFVAAPRVGDVPAVSAAVVLAPPDRAPSDRDEETGEGLNSDPNEFEVRAPAEAETEVVVVVVVDDDDGERDNDGDTEARADVFGGAPTCATRSDGRDAAENVTESMGRVFSWWWCGCVGEEHGTRNMKYVVQK